MYLGGKPIIHCGECKQVIDGLYWTVADKPESYEDKDGKKHVIDDEFINVKILCDRDFVHHIAEKIREAVDPRFQMGILPMYTHIYGPCAYNTDKMRVLLNAAAIVIEEEELKKEQEKKDG